MHIEFLQVADSYQQRLVPSSAVFKIGHFQCFVAQKRGAGSHHRCGTRGVTMVGDTTCEGLAGAQLLGSLIGAVSGELTPPMWKENALSSTLRQDQYLCAQ